VAARSPQHAALGWTIKQLRSRHELSQEEFGYLVGLHRNQVGSIERGEQNITVGLVFRIGRALELPLGELFAMIDERHTAAHRRRSVR
jgi:transcriptional regulator with XRE-family HTH domain